MHNQTCFIKFSRSFFYSLILFLLAVAGCTNAPSDNRGNALHAGLTDAQQLLLADEVLHRQLQAVLEADSAYALVLDNSTPAALDEKSGSIIQSEMALQNSIDSLEQALSKNKVSSQNAITRLTGYFKAILQNRTTVSDMRMALSAVSDDSTTAQQTLQQLQSHVREKDKRIAALEHASAGTNKRTGPQGQNANAESYNSNTAANGNPAQLKQQNNNLQQALKTMESKYFVVGRNYLLLKQEHERTLNELAALRKGQD